MNKPRDWDTTQAYGDYTPLPPGAYICKILRVEEDVSSSRLPMLKITLDIHEGKYTGFFRKRYDADTRPDKKWPCIYHQVTQNHDGSTSGGFKAFVTSVENSNPGMIIKWDSTFLTQFKSKLVGVLFRSEEFIKREGGTSWATKAYQFRSTNSLADCPVPEKKPLSNGAPIPASSFVPTDDTDDDDVPF